MVDILRVKRRAVGGAAGAPASLAAAEIAFNEQDNVLYYGGGNSAGAATSIFSIGGPGAFLRLAGGTLIGNLKISVADAQLGLLVNGATKGARFVASASGFSIEGVDNTGVGSYQPLTINGSVVNLTAPTTISSSLAVTGAVSGAGFTSLFAAPPTIGNTTPSTGAFTTLGATGVATFSGGGTFTGTFAGTHTYSGAVTSSGSLNWTSTGSTTSRSAQTRTAEVFNVKDWGAVGNNVADDTTAIQACMDAAAAAGGGTVLFPVGNYKISATLNIGNGTSAAVSTKAGVVLVGMGSNPCTGFWAGYTLGGSVQLIWAGGAANMISVNGPIQGWGVQNIALFGGATATAIRGIYVISGQFGDCRNVLISNCVTTGIGSTTVAPFGAVADTDSIHNAFRGINIAMPNVASVMGIVLTGVGPAFTSNTCFNTFEDVFIALASTAACYAVYLQNADTNTFINLHIAGGSATARGIMHDYSFVTGQIMPSGNSFFGVETNGTVLGANQFLNSGTPSVNARPNYIRGLNQANGGTNPVMANFLPDLPVVFCPTVFLASQTAAIAGVNIVTPFMDGTYRVSIYLAIQALGNNVTVNASLAWNDGAARSFNTPQINMSTGTNNPVSVTLPVINVANQPIGYSTSVSGALGTGQYKLAIVIERLS